MIAGLTVGVTEQGGERGKGVVSQAALPDADSTPACRVFWGFT